MRRRVQVAALVFALAGARAAHAQTYVTELDPDRFVTTSDPTSIALTESATPLDAHALAVGLALRLGTAILPVCVESPARGCTVEGDIVGDRVGSDLTFAMGFGRLGVHAQLPVVLYQRGDFGPTMGGSELSSAGIGDLRLGAKAWLVRAGGATVGADLTFTVPTGTGDFIGDAGTVIEPRLIADWRRGPLALVGSLGYAARTSSQTIADLYVDDELLWTGGVEYAMRPGKLSVGVALFGRIGVMTQPDPMNDDGAPSSAERMTEVLASSRYWVTRSIALEVGAGTAIDAGYGAPSFRALAGVRWVKRSRPAPVIAPVLERAPVGDRDGDGMLDDKDECVDVAEDADGWQDEDGCPDLDNDDDGIVDASDGCPVDAEDVDTFQDDDGCPDLDNDGDRIADAVDQCPDVAEIVNGFQDDDGCPDDPPKLDVASVDGKLDEPIYFDLNKATIKRRSRKVLQAVVDALQATPNARVRVEGHTDDTGGQAWNQELSEARAAAVRGYLIDKGIAADRLESIGYGNTRPKVENNSEALRRRNRRVEFVVID